jgi:hypothetical protein
MNELILGNQLTHVRTKESGFVIGFYMLTPAGEAHVEDDPLNADTDAAIAGWFSETSYRLARARQNGFVLIGNAQGRAYWRLANVRPVEEVDR